jgi:hypothetical protein
MQETFNWRRGGPRFQEGKWRRREMAAAIRARVEDLGLAAALLFPCYIY